MRYTARRRRALFGLFVVDMGFAVTLSGCLWLASARPAMAYVDPSVMTYTIQALAGVAVALGAVAGVVWRRARKRVLALLHIDENAGKIVEPAVEPALAKDDDGSAGAGTASATGTASGTVSSAASATGSAPHAPGATGGASATVHASSAASPAALRAAANEQARREREAQGKRRRPRPLTWRERFALALAAAAALSFTAFIAAPFEVVLGNTGSLSFTIANVWLPLVTCAALLALVLAGVISLTRSWCFDLLLALVAGLGICMLLQEVLLNVGLPTANGAEVDWSLFASISASSTAVWVGLLGALCLMSLVRPVVTRCVVVLAATVLIVAQGAGLGMLFASKQAELSRPVVTEEGLMSVSSKKNVVVFILDTFDTGYMDDVLLTYPEHAQALGGFTYFHNSAGSMIPTRYGVPCVTLGKQFDTSVSELNDEELASWFNEDNLLDVAARAGYSVGAYSDSFTDGLDALSRKTMNVHGIDAYTADFAATVQTLGGCGLYRLLPWAMKPQFRFTTDDVNSTIASGTAHGTGSTPYTMSDISYYENLQDTRLSADDAGEAGAMRVIHLQGSHGPYFLDQNLQRRTKGTWDYESCINQSSAALKIVEEYIAQLKELGVYDNTTIMITADHGVFPFGEAALGKQTTPIMLVKPAGADTSVPLMRSDVPTGHLDIKATLSEAMSVETDAPTMFEVAAGSRPRYFYWIWHDGKVDHELVEYEIDGEALNFADWHATGRTWPIDVDGYN